MRAVDTALGERPLRFDPVRAAFSVGRRLESVGRYWNRRGPRQLERNPHYYSNLAVWGWDLRDAFARTWRYSAKQVRTADGLRNRIRHPLARLSGVTSAMDRTAIRTLWNSSARDPQTTQVTAAKALADNGGIETLVVGLGSNNALSCVIGLKLAWSEAPGYTKLETKDQYTVWTPDHFRAELGELERHVRAIGATHTLWMTVPHVTVVPLLRGVGEKPYRSRYFARYTRPWITDAEFDPALHPSLSGDEARAIDAAIDQYNYAIKKMVHDARVDQHEDWLLVDLCGLLDRVAYRRYLASPDSRPKWWKDFEKKEPVLPDALLRLSPVPDTRFFTSDSRGRTGGGLIALDGVHPTTIGYGLMAQLVLDVINTTSVRGKTSNSSRPPSIDFNWLVKQDSLIQKPPTHLDEYGRAVRLLNDKVDLWDVYRGKRPL